MKLLFDENLSRKLPVRLAELFPGSLHVSDLGLLTSPDSAVWKRAQEAGFTVVSADSDFFDLATQLGPPPQVIWLRDWRHPTRDAEAILRREAVRISELGTDSSIAILILDRDPPR